MCGSGLHAAGYNSHGIIQGIASIASLIIYTKNHITFCNAFFSFACFSSKSANFKDKSMKKF